VIKKKMCNISVCLSSEALAILSGSHSNEHKGQLFYHVLNMAAKSSVLRKSDTNCKDLKTKCCGKYLAQGWL
jgi:hypothetical protein